MFLAIQVASCHYVQTPLCRSFFTGQTNGFIKTECPNAEWTPFVIINHYNQMNLKKIGWPNLDQYKIYKWKGYISSDKHLLEQSKERGYCSDWDEPSIFLFIFVIHAIGSQLSSIITTYPNFKCTELQSSHVQFIIQRNIEVIMHWGVY